MLSLGGNEPVRMICPGKTYRRDDDDATHSHQFMQIEGLLVDHNISLSDLKGTCDVIAKKLFGLFRNYCEKNRKGNARKK
jgi:phenylalanyl-tRNA synthetase alpha chain